VKENICWSIDDKKKKKVFRISDYLKINEAAAFLGVSAETLRNWEKVKKITAYRNPMNKYRLYKKEDLEKLLLNIEQK
jgi:MerR family transcriptional regulator, copper efflux regulator